jgi:hypothetical protein
MLFAVRAASPCVHVRRVAWVRECGARALCFKTTTSAATITTTTHKTTRPRPVPAVRRAQGGPVEILPPHGLVPAPQGGLLQRIQLPLLRDRPLLPLDGHHHRPRQPMLLLHVCVHVRACRVVWSRANLEWDWCAHVACCSCVVCTCVRAHIAIPLAPLPALSRRPALTEMPSSVGRGALCTHSRVRLRTPRRTLACIPVMAINCMLLLIAAATREFTLRHPHH